MSGSSEIEKAAFAYAKEAVKLDQQGNKAKAIEMYQKARQSLLQLAMAQPDYGPNKVYLQKAIAYQERIKQLLGSSP